MENKQEQILENKQEKIIEMFNEIAPNYDRINRIMSMGVDVAWRRDACKRALELQKNNPLCIADIACGTGDMILHWEKQSRDRKVSFIGIDPSSKMLEVAKEKLSKIPAKLHESMAQDLWVLENESVDVLSIAYGIRNVVDIERALSEFWRVLKPNGVLVILEFTRKECRGFLDKMMQFYTRKILPVVGGMISRNYRAYAYLPHSIDGFLSTEVLEQKIKERGFKMMMVKGYNVNISTLFLAKKEQ
ncbi:bifunctional demethylmenaquinone methyltransferase/2-methoxy-6-polyprenyl-1,4-benzoquinol methylase UbiE [Helicobacter mustelae]|nr:bifunctional demethylmenaquinone methyltransferase/2-methoxy-6-polyprenyl-1,4-benzoquinol methylase UbiE [Helicobacter mustelae]